MTHHTGSDEGRAACAVCGLRTAPVEDVVNGTARYADSPGGHADRHTLVIEAAEAALAERPTDGAGT